MVGEGGCSGARAEGGSRQRWFWSINNVACGKQWKQMIEVAGWAGILNAAVAIEKVWVS